MKPPELDRALERFVNLDMIDVELSKFQLECILLVATIHSERRIYNFQLLVPVRERIEELLKNEI